MNTPAATVLARSHRLADAGHHRSVRTELGAISRGFKAVFHDLTVAVKSRSHTVRGAEWLLDNDYVIQRAIRLVRKSLPAHYVRQLPVVADSDRIRVRELSDYALQSGGIPIDIDWLTETLLQYQHVKPLSTGELWALPAILRLSVLTRLLKCAEALLDAEKSDRDAAVGGTANEIASLIVSLRTLETQDWLAFVEGVSPLEPILAADPSGHYPMMDKATRNLYRREIEQIARWTGGEEVDIAQRALALATRHASDDRRQHIGYGLIDEGRIELERQTGARVPWLRRCARWMRANASWLYPAAIVGLAVAATAPAILAMVGAGARAAAVIATAAPLFVVASAIATALVNWCITQIVPPRVLPKLDFQHSVTRDCRAAVALPVILANPGDVAPLLTRLEMNYLGNSEANLHYVLLTDLADADCESKPGDSDVLEALRDGISALAGRYEDGRFSWLHRPRLYNPVSSRWMGWERKRGKLADFNRLVLGGDASPFSERWGDFDALRAIRFVITLDADTLLPTGAAQRLVGTCAHPLNRAEFDASSGRLSAGYTVIQPRVETSPESANRSAFARSYSGDTLLDLYSTAVSDVYFDVIGSAIFAGKAAYDVAALERTLDGCVPENAILSHDLFEGLHGRVGLASDISVFEDFPPSIPAYMRRLHRWVRGDWQLLPWLWPRVPADDKRRQASRFTFIDRWKIGDNLRRSLLAPSLLVLLALSWLLATLPVWVVLGTVVAAIAMPLWLGLASGLLGLLRPGAPTRRAMATTGWTVRHESRRAALALMLLPYEASTCMDAIARTLWRLRFGRDKLLEWVPAAFADRSLGPTLGFQTALRECRFALLLVALIAILLAGLASLQLVAAQALLTAVPIVALWLLGPALAGPLSRTTPAVAPQSLADEERRTLRLLARKTWSFFEAFVGPDSHWLPPDNRHEEPREFLAERTSPTNIGLMLVATLAAHDQGYLTTNGLAARLNHTLDTLEQLPRYHGHFLNWYHTRTLEPLEPRYVSTVDSGNLVGALLVVAEGLLDAGHAPLQGGRLRAGFNDTVGVLRDHLQSHPGEGNGAEFEHCDDLLSVLTQSTAAGTWRAALVKAQQTLLPLLVEAVTLRVEQPDAHFSSEEVSALRADLGQISHLLEGMLAVCDRLLPLLDGAPGLPQATCATTRRWLADLPTPANLVALPDWCIRQRAALGELAGAHDLRQDWLTQMSQTLDAVEQRAREDLDGLDSLRRRCMRLVEQTDFGQLYDSDRHLFFIGYNVSASEFDANHYDLLASEARLASYIAIARRQVPVKHWLHLGRPFNRLGTRRVLMSWSATAFEYLMPRLFMASPGRGVMDQSCEAAVAKQVRFGASHGVPWGISESGFYELDEQSHYQYRAFGVPGLGLKREAQFRLVISPYASLLALPYAASDVMTNLNRIAALDGIGRYGAFEAIDFGAIGSVGLAQARIVRSYMSHHQGMILMSIVNALHDDTMVRRFHRHRDIQRVEYLLFERLPPGVPGKLGYRSAGHQQSVAPTAEGLTSWQPREPRQLNLLSNGALNVHVTSDGATRLTWRGLQLTRGAILAAPGEASRRIYLRDADDGRIWSPCEFADGEQAHLRFAPHETQFHYSKHGLRSRLDITVAQDHDVEISRLTLTNLGTRERTVQLLQYCEPVLAPPADDERHPGFSKLFVEASRPSADTLIFRRRPRGAHERPVYLAQSLVGANVETMLCCTDRGDFLGRGGHYRQPTWFDAARPGVPGATPTLDPIGALGAQVRLASQKTVELVWLTAVNRNRRRLLNALRHYRQRQHISWAFSQASFASERELLQLGLAPNRVPQVMAVVSRLFALRGNREAKLRAARDIRYSLWSRGISGDWPILLLNLREASDIDIAKDAVLAHRYCGGRGIAADLVILDHVSAGYSQPTRDELQRLADHSNRAARDTQTSRVILIGAGDLDGAAARAIAAAARVTLDSANGPIEKQLRAPAEPVPPPPFVPMSSAAAVAIEETPVERPVDLILDNGLGGISADHEEYIVHLEGDDLPPQPWINVLANPRFGSLVSASGAMFTWCGNSGENRLTPWYNDPVRDPTGEAIYLRDEESAAVWSPTPRPAPAGQPYQVSHGIGYTRFVHCSHGIEQVLTVHVDATRPVKFMTLSLKNLLSRPRRVTATCYAEWVLGGEREHNAPFIVPEFVSEHAALLARNSFVSNARGAPGDDEPTAFVTSSLTLHGMTADRREFLGADGDAASPVALGRIGLSGRLDAGIDPCAALQVHIDLGANATTQLHFALGQGESRDAALALIKEARHADAAAISLADSTRRWRRALDGCRVSTPDPAFDALVNRRLLYQAQACRLWARAALYQCGGGLGFRDQLQDAMALMTHQPELARGQILDAARSQFVEGDVLHWWHNDPRRGVRTRCSDDLLWLPFVTSHYIEVTGDNDIFEEELPFLRAPPLAESELERYAEFEHTIYGASLYEHCWRAIDRALALRGARGLPLIGTCDWNDGFSRVGVEGRGESVWLAWFLIATCEEFAPHCAATGDELRAENYLKASAELRAAVEQHGWDGRWYRRAYYDDGTPLGSESNRECRIDLNAQSWAVIAGITDRARAEQAMDSVIRELVAADDRLILLLTPPFDKTTRDPGYIKGYPRGVRENGAQYTHAAVWAVWAMARLGRREDTARLFDYLNPLLRCRDRDAVDRYRVEPYVMAADIYSAPPFNGRGGWTWYTGAAGWMHRLAVEQILGLSRRGDRLDVRPLLPPSWPGYTARWRHGTSTYLIDVRVADDAQASGVTVAVDGVPLPDGHVPLVDDGTEHRVAVRVAYEAVEIPRGRQSGFPLA